MPNISFDIFYNTDIVNITATRSGGAPKPKPEWKVRRAPKLAPKYVPKAEEVFGPPKITELPDDDTASNADTVKTASKPKPAKAAPKLKAQDQAQKSKSQPKDKAKEQSEEQKPKDPASAKPKSKTVSKKQ